MKNVWSWFLYNHKSSYFVVLTCRVIFFLRVNAGTKLRIRGNGFFVDICRYSVISYMVLRSATAVHFSKGNTPARWSCALIMNSALARFEPTMVHSPGHVRPRGTKTFLFTMCNKYFTIVCIPIDVPGKEWNHNRLYVKRTIGIMYIIRVRRVQPHRYVYTHTYIYRRIMTHQYWFRYRIKYGTHWSRDDKNDVLLFIY